jgi:hypothetical protein
MPAHGRAAVRHGQWLYANGLLAPHAAAIRFTAGLQVTASLRVTM